MKTRTWISIAILSLLAVFGLLVYMMLYSYDEDGAKLANDSAYSDYATSRADLPLAKRTAAKADSGKPKEDQVQNESLDAVASGSLKLEKVLDLPWGDAPGQVGRKEADESAPEGPMSFFVDDSGRIILLDQVNSRVQVFDEGTDPAIVNLPDDTYQDVATSKDGDVVVMDRLARKEIETYGPDGKLIASASIEGQGVDEGGGVTGMFQRPDGTWVEVEHGKLVRVADMSGKTDSERPVLPGRFSADGTRLLSALKDGPDSALVLARPADSPGQVPIKFARIHFDTPLAYLNALDSDSTGRVFVGAVLMQEPSDSSDSMQSWEEIIAFDQFGRELGRVRMPVFAGALEQFCSIRVGADGVLYWLRLGPNGAQLVKIVL